MTPKSKTNFPSPLPGAHTAPSTAREDVQPFRAVSSPQRGEEPTSAFSVEARDSATHARAGLLKTRHGTVQTPVFMPVATQAAVKTLTQEDLDSLGVRTILANAYHLYLRPGTAVVRKAGGLQKFMGYSGAILTDSGGFQVMSLSDLRKIDDEGVTFKSHLDGSMHTLTPEKVIQIQSELGSDMWTTLDECVAWPATEEQARQALDRTMRWTERSRAAYENLAISSFPSHPAPPLFFPLLQGSLFTPLRRMAVEHLESIPHDGVSIGGFSVGEQKEMTWEILARTVEFLGLETEKPRYLMGVGTPEDLWEAAAQGIDMLDCVWPTRVARHGMAMTSRGRLNLMNAACREDFGPLDSDCRCLVCHRYSRAYLSHLLRAQEQSSGRLLSHHNLHFLMEIMRTIRSAIIEGRFTEARAQFFEKYAAQHALSPTGLGE